MKYTIMGFQQNKLIDEKLGVDDALLLNSIKDMYASPKMDFKTIKGIRYMWINYNWLLKQVPIIGSRATLMRKVKDYSEKNLLLRVLENSKDGKKGSYAYISPTNKLFDLQDYDEEGYLNLRQGVSHNETDGISNRDNKDTSIKDTPIKDKKNTQSVSNYNNFYKKIMSITNLNIMQIQQVLLPIKLKDLNIDKITTEIDNSDFLLKQKGMQGFRKYFSTIQQIKKIETGYYQNDTKKAVNDKELFGGI